VLDLKGVHYTSDISAVITECTAYGLDVYSTDVPAEDRMQIISVLDIARGTAVHARAGDRTRYLPLQSVLLPGRASDPIAVCQAVQSSLDIRDCYIADLDAIQGGTMQQTLIQELAALSTSAGGAVLVDAGIHLPEQAAQVLCYGATHVVVGLETLQSFGELRNILEEIGSSPVIFSLDLRIGTPVLHPAMREARGQGSSQALTLAAQAADAGVSTVLVLDVGRVGTGTGADLGLLASLRHELGELRLLAGGGVQTREDLERISDAGCDGVLVASAIHQGRLNVEDVAAIFRLERRSVSPG
jgi:phosphoribosylformimino-5-aminoimidazole carboxamide ribotide isomerase